MTGPQAAAPVTIIVASSATDFADGRSLFEEYAAQLGGDLCFQGFSAGLGRRLAEASMAAGLELGYRRMVLDTLATMTAARALYEQLGFTDRTACYDNPTPGVSYLERTL